MHCWKAFDNHVQGVIDITLGTCFQGFKRIQKWIATKLLNFSIYSILFLYTLILHGWDNIGLNKQESINTIAYGNKYLHVNKYAHKYLRSHQHQRGNSSFWGPAHKWAQNPQNGQDE